METLEEREYATWYQRNNAFMTDITLVGIFVFILFLFTDPFLHAHLPANHSDALVTFIDDVATAFMYVAYYAFFHAHSGQTPGKKRAHIKLITLEGYSPSLMQCVIRTLPCLIVFIISSFIQYHGAPEITHQAASGDGLQQFLATAQNMQRQLETTASNPSGGWFTGFITLFDWWLLLCFIVLMLHRRNHTIHDFISQTEVVSAKAPHFSFAEV